MDKSRSIQMLGDPLKTMKKIHYVNKPWVFLNCLRAFSAYQYVTLLCLATCEGVTCSLCDCFVFIWKILINISIKEYTQIIGTFLRWILLNVWSQVHQIVFVDSTYANLFNQKYIKTIQCSKCTKRKNSISFS